MALSVGWGVAGWVGSFFMSHYLTPLGVNFLLLPGSVRLRYWTGDWKVASSSSGRSTVRQQPWASCSHTRAPLSPSSKFGTGQGAVMPCGWEGNRRSGVALAMRHRLPWFIHLRAHGVRKGDEPRAYMRDGILYLTFNNVLEKSHYTLSFALILTASMLVLLRLFRRHQQLSEKLAG